MMDNPLIRIGIFDSGLGGISLARTLHRYLPLAQLIYVADNAYVPYGDKTQAFIQSRCHEVVTFLHQQSVDAVLFACNTATALAIDVVRATKYERSVPIIGIEPAIKTACAADGVNKVAVLGTKNTLSSERYQSLKTSVATKPVIDVECDGFARLVENQSSDAEITDLLKRRLSPVVSAHPEINVVTLSCTHYVFLKKRIADFFRERGIDCTLMDNSESVVEHLIRKLQDVGKGGGCQATTTSGGMYCHMTDFAAEDRYRTFLNHHWQGAYQLYATDLQLGSQTISKTP